MNWKRIALVAGFILVSLLLAFLIIYFFFLAPTPSPTTTPEPTPIPTPGLPTGTGLVSTSPATTPSEEVVPTPSALPTRASEAQGGRVVTQELTTDRMQDIHLAGDGKSIVSYNNYDKRFYRITPDGKAETITDRTFVAVDAYALSPQADKAIVRTLDGRNILYDFDQKRQVVTLPSHWESFQFGPSGDEIGFKSMGLDPDNRWLAIANADGSGSKQIENLGKKAGLFEVSWSPSDHIIGTFREAIDNDRQRLYMIGKNNENFKAVTIPGRGIETQWSPSGEQLLFSAYSTTTEFKPALWIVDALGDDIGENRRDLQIPTWAHKCTFANADTLYCAIPPSLEKGAGLLPFTYDKGPDMLYRIEVKTGSKTRIAQPQDAHAIDKIVVTKDQSLLYFTDKNTGRLYKIDL